MKDLITTRLKHLTDRRDALTKRLTEFYAGSEYLATPQVDREALEARHDMPQVMRKLWELRRRTALLEGAASQPSDDAATAYLELMNTGARQYLEKGLSEDATHSDFLEFLGRGIDLEECTRALQAPAIVEAIKAKNRTRENARKGA